MNSSHRRIFKYIGFVSSHYVNTISLDVMSSFTIFSKFVFISQSDILLV